MFQFRTFFALALFMNSLPASSLEPKVVEVPQQLEAKASATNVFRVAAWNMQWFPGQTAKSAKPEAEAKQSKAARKILDKEKPVILFGAEVRNLEALKKIVTGPVSLACTQIPRTEEEGLDMYNQGLALVSRVPWKKLWALDFSGLPAAPDRPYRGILGAEFQIEGNRSLFLYGFHLKSNRGNPESVRMRREKAIEYLRWDWKRLGLDPQKNLILLVGDFNTSLTMSTYQKEQTLRTLLQQGFVDGAEGMPPYKRMTLPASRDGRYPPADFDQILLSPALAAAMKNAKPWATVVPAPGAASDHYLMRIDLPLKSQD